MRDVQMNHLGNVPVHVDFYDGKKMKVIRLKHEQRRPVLPTSRRFMFTATRE